MKTRLLYRQRIGDPWQEAYYPTLAAARTAASVYRRKFWLTIVQYWNEGAQQWIG